jgi:hypothetical protein
MAGPDVHKRDVAAMIEAFDDLARRVERTIAQLELELEPARAGGDDRYIRRVERGLSQSRELLTLLDEDGLRLLMDLRHNAQQLVYAREGKMV